MELNHLDLPVADIRRAAALFTGLFGFRERGNPNSPAIAILEGDSGFVLVLQRQIEPAPYPEGFHFGFYVDDVAKVLEVQSRARAAGLDATELIENNRGSMIYLRTPDIPLIEVNCRSAAVRSATRSASAKSTET